MNATPFNIGAWAWGGVDRPRALVRHADTLAAHAECDEVDNAEAYLSHFVYGAEMAAHFIIIDYEKYDAFASGIALIKAPGHTPGSQMIYVKLASGAEYLFVGDAAWHMDGIRQIRGKDADWVKEDEKALAAV